MGEEESIFEPFTGGSSVLDHAVRMADMALARGDFQAALSRYAAAVRERPAVAEYRYRLGTALWYIERHHDAVAQLEEAIRLKPEFASAHGTLGRLLLVRGDIEGALAHARRAVELEPGGPDLRTGLASALAANRQTEEAWEIVDRLLREAHETTRLALQFATMAPEKHREAEALALVERVLARSEAALPRWRASLHFAAANLLDRLERYDEAFEQAERAHALRGTQYDIGQAARPVHTFIAYFNRPTMRRLPRATHGSQTPVFIVGLPRSGTTLVEQIIASHPMAYGAGELEWIFGLWESAVRQCAPAAAGITQCLDAMSVAQANALADEYLKPLQALCPGAARITDKMPTNFLHLGLIAILFPQARVIHCRRDPLDTCLSCYLTDFAAGHDFACSLKSLGEFYRLYSQLMAHWREALDLRMLEVDYEAVVGDLEGQTRRLLDFLDLPWDERCLRFFENSRFVATASTAQVRRPIYEKSVGRSENYRKHLTSLRDAVGGRQ